MTGVAIEQMLELWCVELRQVKAHLKSRLNLDTGRKSLGQRSLKRLLLQSATASRTPP